MSAKYLAFVKQEDAETAARRLGTSIDGAPFVMEVNLVRSMKGMTMTTLHKLLDADVI